MNYGLALAGGGTRGAAHAGVLLALKEEKLLPGYIAGTSAGSITAGCFAAGVEAEELCDAVRHLAIHGMDYLDPDIVGLLLLVPQIILHRSISLSGLLKGKRLNKYFCSLTKEERMETLEYPLLIPSVDLMTGDTVCFTNIKKFREHRSTQNGSLPDEKMLKAGNTFEGKIQWVNTGKLCDIMMASSSVPGIFRPMRMNGGCLVDGGVTDNLPADLLKTAGVKKIVAVDIGSAYKMPGDECVFEIVSHSFSIMSGNLKDCHSRGETLLLRPKLTNKAGLLTFEYMEECMEEAYSYTKKNAGAIREALEG